MKPQVKESEKSRVLTTKDYSMFEFPDFKISTKHLEKIKESIIEKNLSKDYPIVVTPGNYKIIEGRYRFLACYDLQVPIYYKISEVTTHKDAIRIKHIHKNLALEDVIKVHIDNVHYQRILELHEKFNGYFSVKVVIQAIPECRANKNTIGSLRINRSIFDSGRLGYWDFDKVHSKLFRIKNFIQKYGEYGWTIEDAFFFQDAEPKEFTGREDWIMKKAREYAWEVNLKNPKGYKICLRTAYYYILQSFENPRRIKDHWTTYEVAALHKIGATDRFLF
jgi:hypothetical protein